MTRQATIQSVLERSMEDLGFAERLRDDPEAALAEYDLSEEEAEALASGDQSRIFDILGDKQLNVCINCIWVTGGGDDDD